MSSGRGQAEPNLVEAFDAAALNTTPGASLARRLVITFFSTAFLLVLAASSILYLATTSSLQWADDQVIDGRAEAIVEILQSTPIDTRILTHEMNEDFQGPRRILMRVITSAPGISYETLGMSKVLPPELIETPPDSGSQKLRANVETPGGMNFRVTSERVPITTASGGAEAILQIATDTTLDEKSLGRFRQILALVLAAAAPLCALASWFAVKRQLLPLKRITQTARAIDGRSLHKRLPLTGLPVELHDLGTDFNQMLARLQATWTDLQHYADTIAHELRTPLNRMRLGCELSLSSVQSPEEVREVLLSTMDECERLTTLLQRLLFLARADSSQASLDRTVFRVHQAAASVRDFHEPVAQEFGLTLRCEGDDATVLSADKELFKQAVSNLVANAIAHTSREGSVVISWETKADKIVVHVTDTGAGIAPEEQQKVFERFYRGSPGINASDTANNQGLGLAITQAIARIHGGSLELSSTVGKGTQVTLIMPSREPASDPVAPKT